MYLLMLLATYMSAIYGYNLSIRPEFDRDVAHKKAAAVAFKFNHQHTTVKNVLVKVWSKSDEFATLLGAQPNDLIFAKDTYEENEKNLVLIYKQGGEEIDVPVRERGRLGETISGGQNLLRPGRLLYDADMMVSKVLCPNQEIDETTVNPTCESPQDVDGHLTGTCCGKDAVAYLISYRKLDARWLNRLTNTVSSDFMWVLSTQSFKNNIGVITWNEASTSWKFVGKIRLTAVYRKDKEKFMEEHKDNPNLAYPLSLIQRTDWKMPNRVFTKEYFTDARGVDKNFCKDGCLFKIEPI